MRYPQVADDWEVPSEDVEIFYSEELGHGAFGRVYRGLLHCRELRDLVTGGRRSTRKRGSFGQRRLSRRKTSQSMGSRLVAIKRLRGLCLSHKGERSRKKLKGLWQYNIRAKFRKCY